MEIQGNFGPVLTQNQQVKDIITKVSRISSSEVSVLITGESGTGKNLLARAIHNSSQRRKNMYVTVNCVAIPDTLIEPELFGHERGAFTDAYQSKRGSFELANQGTLFLDEIADMSQTAQGKILKAVEEKHFRRVGGEKELNCDVRIISATNKDIENKITDGEFRSDLFYRLREVHIHLPPLRDRKEDLPLLIRHFVECYGKMYAKPDLKVSDTVINYLSNSYDWPGNFRELKNVIKSAVLLCPQDTIWLEHFPFSLTFSSSLADGNKVKAENEIAQQTIDSVVKNHVLLSLNQFSWNKKKTSEFLGISRPRLDRYIEKFNLTK